MPNESNLVKRCQAGDERAFAELVDAHKVKVAGIVYRMIGRTESVEDIAQEVFLQVFRGIGGFRGEAALSTWIYRITYRICLREIDRQPCTGTDVFFDDDETSAEVLHSTGENTETCERLESVRQWLADLPDHYRWAVTLYYLQNKKYKDVAEVMDVPIGTVKTYLHRAKQHIRQRILDEGYLD